MMSMMASFVIESSRIEEAAVDLLKSHDLHRTPVNPVEVCERSGVAVFRTRFASDDTCGILQRDEPAIYVDERQSLHQQNFAIAHALGHFVLHARDQATFVDKSIDLYRVGDSETESARRETQANTFAAALLMPADLLRERSAVTTNLGQLADEFLVSEGDIGRRLSQLDMVAAS